MENEKDELAERIRNEMTISNEEYERRKAAYLALPPKKPGRPLGSHSTSLYKKGSTIKKLLQAEKASYSYDDIRLAYKLGKEDGQREQMIK